MIIVIYLSFLWRRVVVIYGAEKVGVSVSQAALFDDFFPLDDLQKKTPKKTEKNPENKIATVTQVRVGKYPVCRSQRTLFSDWLTIRSIVFPTFNHHKRNSRREVAP